MTYEPTEKQITQLGTALDEQAIKNLGMIRVIFVGIHNKPGLSEALCSSTKSGAIIDQVAEGLQKAKPNRFITQKTNLFNRSFELPTVNPVYHWSKRIRPTEGDIVILLGSRVTYYFKRERRFTYCPQWHSVGHPSRASREYVSKLIDLIIKTSTE
jgi:hypothetical protein